MFDFAIDIYGTDLGRNERAKPYENCTAASMENGDGRVRSQQISTGTGKIYVCHLLVMMQICNVAVLLCWN